MKSRVCYTHTHNTHNTHAHAHMLARCIARCYRHLAGLQTTRILLDSEIMVHDAVLPSAVMKQWKWGRVSRHTQTYTADAAYSQVRFCPCSLLGNTLSCILVGGFGLEIQNALSVHGPISSQLPCSRFLYAHSHVLDAGQHALNPTHQLKGGDFTWRSMTRGFAGEWRNHEKKHWRTCVKKARDSDAMQRCVYVCVIFSLPNSVFITREHHHSNNKGFRSSRRSSPSSLCSWNATYPSMCVTISTHNSYDFSIVPFRIRCFHGSLHELPFLYRLPNPALSD